MSKRSIQKAGTEKVNKAPAKNTQSKKIEKKTKTGKKRKPAKEAIQCFF